MIYLTGKEAGKIDKALKEQEIECRITSWSDLNKIKKGMFILTEIPADSKAQSDVMSLVEHAIPVIAIIEDNKDSFSYDSVLKLPHDISMPLLITIIKWILFQKDCTVYLEVFNSFFEGADFQIFFINKENKVIYTVPEEDFFLGYKGESLLNKEFEKTFGLSLDSISRNKKEKNHLYSINNINGKETSVNIVKLSSEKAEIPGTPEETVTILFLTEVNAYKSLKDKADRMTMIQANMTKMRAVELEAANEILQKQAIELKNAMEQLDKRNNQIIEELSLASELQKSLIPKDFPADLPLNFSQKYLPYAYIGGDFFEIIRLDKDKIGIIITDVSGHGVAAAFITAMFKTSFYHFALNNFSPASTLSKLNKEFSANLHTEHYLTAFYAIFDTAEMKCTYCNAGHPSQLLFRENGDVEELTTMGFFIGMFEGTEYEDKVIDLMPGDRIVYFTDGIIEVEDAAGEQFGRKNLKKIFSENKDKDITDISNLVIQELMMYMASDSFQDDITLLITEIMESI